MMRVLLFVTILSLFHLVSAQAKTRVVVLDVNEGQAVLIQHESNAWLIDTGHLGESVRLLGKLRDYGVRKLEGLILTHLHPDHASGYFRLKEAYPGMKIFSNCHSLPENIQPDTTRWVYEALLKDSMHQCLSAGDVHKVFDVKLNILWPYRFINHNLNHHSLVIDVVNGNQHVLLMGDADLRAEKSLLEKNTLPDNVMALIVGHHGANDATSLAFLEKIKPELAIISTNRNNIRGYPSEAVIDRLNALRVEIKRTDMHGDINIDFN